jgi:Tol biopolymer transport system component
MRGWSIVPACWTGCLLVPGVAAAARPMSIQDLLTAIRISDPQLSPDGGAVAFVRTTTDMSSGKRNADIWIVPADGSSAARLLVGGEQSENTPRWSPDGKHLAFISTRGGSAQLYVANADGGNVQQITRLAAGVQPPVVFSPDGASLAFVSDVSPACTDEACNAREQAAAEKNPVKAHMLTRLLYRHWDEWHDRLRHHVFVVAATGGDARDLTPGDFDSPPTQQEDEAIAFTPDGHDLAFVSNREGADRQPTCNRSSPATAAP